MVSHPFEGFGAQKNFALSLAQGEWVISLDADERVSENLGKEIMQAIGRASADGYEMPPAVDLLRAADASFRLVSRLCAAGVPARQGALFRRPRA